MTNPPRSNSLRAIVFDLDGLMFNTEDLYQEVGRIVLERRGKQLTGDLVNEMMGRKSHVALQLMIDYHALSDTADALATESMEIMFELLPQQLSPLPGLMSLLRSLESAGIPKAIATGSNRVFAIHVLQLFELQLRFDFILTSEDTSRGKPAPDVYLLAAEKHDLPPAEILVLEDSQVGCQAAVAAGTFAIAVPGGQSTEHDFTGVQLIADSLEDPRIYALLDLPLNE